MKLTAILLLSACLQVSATGFSQNITLSEKNVSLQKVFKQIHKQTGYQFFYEDEMLNKAGRISINVKDAPLEKVLAICFKDAPFTYSVENNAITVKPKNVDVVLQSQLPAINNIHGTVKDEKGNPLAGVSVIVKGTTKGTSTGTDGSFSIDANVGDVLEFSIVGYREKSVKVGQNDNISVVMEIEAAMGSEVVVVGYGTQKKIDLTGSVATVSGSVLAKRPVTDAATMLEGQLSGVNVVQTTGQPGVGSVSIQVRGFGTFSGAGVSPLVLIDGVPGNIENLNPSTIESVTVLKDAASASIYGSQGANGVILVTTKSGENSNGKIKVVYDFNYGIHTPTKLVDEETNSPDYMRAWNVDIKNANYGTDIPSEEYTAAEIAEYTNPTNPILYPSFDWEHFIIRAAPTSIQNLSISGGKQTHYNLSLGYTDENGTMAAFDYKRYNAQLNIVTDVNKKLKIGANIGLKSGTTISDFQGQQNYMITTLAMAPTVMPTLPGQPDLYSWRAFPFESNNWNPYEQLKNHGATTNDYALTSQIWADLEIVKGLHWYTKAAANYATSQYVFYASTAGYERLYSDSSIYGYQYSPTSLTNTNTQDLFTNVYSYLTYEKKIGLHHFNLMAGYSNEEDNANNISAYRTNYASAATPVLNAGSVNSSLTNSGDASSWAIESGFGRLNYNYNEKYLFEANVRYDGTSRLSQSTRWGTFPSVSAGWRFSQESFMQSSKSWLSDAKLRASWGMLGNQNIGTYPYQAVLNLTGAYPFNNTSLSPGVAQTSLNNQYLTWEKTTSTDIGLDATLFNKVSITFDVYKKLTTDILRGAQVTAVVGLGAPTINNGAMQNTGFDFDMQYQDRVKTGIFRGLNFGAGLIVSAFKNKLVKFGVAQDNGSSIDSVGLPWNTFYVFKVKGIFQNAAQIAAAPKQFGENTQPGMLQYVDVNHDSVINNSDRVALKKGVFPAFTYGFHLSASWKSFDLYGFFQGVAGSSELVSGWGIQPFVQGSPPTKTQYSHAWTPENQSTSIVEIGDPTDFNHPSTYTLYNNSYWRLKTLQIGYSLPDKWIGKSGISRLRVYFAGDNLLTITKYPGLDPENTGSGRFVSYPQNKVVSFGCNVTF